MATIDAHSYDLTTEAGVEGYLSNTAFACTKAEALSGGTANFVFRIHLREARDGKETLVLKHGQLYIKSLPSIAFDIQRQSFEVEALRRIREWLPSTAFVTVPTVYLFDEKEHVIIMDDCGSDCMTLKSFMQSGRCTAEIAHRIGKEVGEFIGQLHAWSRVHPEMCKFFEQNPQAKEMSSWAFYGRLVQTFDDGLEKLQDPDVRLTEEERKALETICEESIDAMKNVTGTFVMGDFWPGNLVLSFDHVGNVMQIRVLDWEMCKPGLFGAELGQFCAELILLTRFNAEVCGQTAHILLEDLLKTYTTHITPDLEMCRRAIVHLGAHLVTLTPRIEWGGKEMTQEVVKEGKRLVLEGYSGEKGWLVESHIKPLVNLITEPK
ncbi:hypothetical protein AGABI2DRAFT_197185 [Agaricus bisporus var. bisporus H97]|uniref:hypothetical protein n=1 Tax=Agaricus bisporus var. bisporus (strain H97 / ATCC MYA-4626 / FGSC 10389) TaxID=936046 RepID=UPI00029F6CCA|nr:hypothetical protein AGABI2DRAFT_197185 [Agaricus bisporus var. bisporus H97]EKV51297.1 hypothetical protein AGABI2DRAFT_197185 [Agaricus bisporus var. bisporus H97]